MPNSFNYHVSRRSILKIGALAVTLVSMPNWFSKSMAQTSGVVTAASGNSKPSGLVSFNAGWMIPVEDQKALLALEAKKNQEAQAAASKDTQSPEVVNEPQKSNKKTWSERLQGSWNQLKSYF